MDVERSLQGSHQSVDKAVRTSVIWESDVPHYVDETKVEAETQ